MLLYIEQVAIDQVKKRQINNSMLTRKILKEAEKSRRRNKSVCSTRFSQFVQKESIHSVEGVFGSFVKIYEKDKKK